MSQKEKYKELQVAYRENFIQMDEIFKMTMAEVKYDAGIGTVFTAPIIRNQQTIYGAEIRKRLDQNEDYVKFSKLERVLLRELNKLRSLAYCPRGVENGQCELCERKAKSKGLCQDHYNERYYKWLDLREI